MKSILFPFIALNCLLLFSNLKAQEVLVPRNYVLKTDSDYVKYQKNVIRCINWIESVPLSQDYDKHTLVNRFLIDWISGSPSVSVSVNSKIVQLTDNNKDLLVIFMGGWVKSVIENPASKTDLLNGYTAGIKSIIKVYQLGGVVKDNDVEKAIKEDKKGQLEDYIQSKIMN